MQRSWLFGSVLTIAIAVGISGCVEGDQRGNASTSPPTPAVEPAAQSAPNPARIRVAALAPDTREERASWAPWDPKDEIPNADLAAAVSDEKIEAPEIAQRVLIQVDPGLLCDNCTRSVHRRLTSLAKVYDANVNKETGLVTVAYGDDLDKEDFLHAVKSLPQYKATGSPTISW